MLSDAAKAAGVWLLGGEYVCGDGRARVTVAVDRLDPGTRRV